HRSAIASPVRRRRVAARRAAGAERRHRDGRSAVSHDAGDGGRRGVMASAKIRAGIIDDEPLARKRLSALLEKEPGGALVGEADGGTAAVALIESLKPDLAFLDIQMPGLDGFGVLRSVTPTHLPLVVFVTAHDDHAIQAFDVHAVDYVLKPVVEKRFREAV